MKKDKFNVIYNSYARQLYYYSLSIVENNFVAEEIIQDAFLRLLKQDKDIENKYAFLKSAVRNLSINYVRDEKRTEEREKVFVDTYIVNESVINDFCDKKERVVRELNKLPEDIRNVIVLKCIHNLKYIEISEDLNIPIDSVKYKIKVGYKKIREGIKLGCKLFF